MTSPAQRPRKRSAPGKAAARKARVGKSSAGKSFVVSFVASFIESVRSVMFLLRFAPVRLVLLAAVVGGGLVACDRLWPSKETASKEEPRAAASPVKAAAPVQQLASAPLPPPAPPEPPPPPAHMSAAQEAGFDAWVVKTYLGCWKPAGQPADADPYVAHVRLAFKPDGSLLKPAKLVNPPSDPALKPQAKSVLAAVHACNPLQVPAQYRPFYDQWKNRTIHFDPQVAVR